MDERPDESVYPNIENVTLKSVDGINIHHTLIKPQLEPKATIFVFQGSGSKVSNWAKLLKPLVEDGYQIFLMDYRGFGSSEGEARHEVVATDAHSAFLYLINLNEVKNKKLLVLGQSYGGQLAINVASNYPEHVDALITEGAFTSFQDIAVHSTPWIGKPFTWMIFSNPYDSTELIKETSVPKLIIHSQEDDVVPLSMGKELYEAAGGKKEFWEISGKHTDALIDYPKIFVLKVNELLGFYHNQ